jgi:hypothetical protein
MLEDNLEQNILREEQSLASEEEDGPESNLGDLGSMHRVLREQKMKFEVCMGHESVKYSLTTRADGA